MTEEAFVRAFAPSLGVVEGSRVRGRWADVPQGRAMNQGGMNLQIVGPNQLRATQRTGVFGGSEWTR